VVVLLVVLLFIHADRDLQSSPSYHRLCRCLRKGFQRLTSGRNVPGRIGCIVPRCSARECIYDLYAWDAFKA
jgi:hypothetical protein